MFKSGLTAADYPLLISAANPVETVAVGSVLAVYNWPVGTERYHKVAQFVEAFLDRLHDMQAPPHNPKWRDIDLASTVPGWTRFAPAEQWIKRAALGDSKPTGNTTRHAAVTQEWTATLSPQDRDAVFKDFLDYQRRQTHLLSNRGLLGSQRLESLFKEFVEYQKRQAHAPGSLAGLPDSQHLDSLFMEFVEYQKRQTHAAGSGSGSPGPWQLDSLLSRARTEPSKYGG